MRWTPAIRLLRPVHWLKNVFVLLPVPFALADGATLHAAALAWGVLGFCLVSSGVYAFNDAFDRERDRLHPRKRKRPVAARDLSVRGALVLGLGAVAAGSASLAMTGSGRAVVLAGIYLLSQVVYTVGAKHVPLLDVFILAGGYLLRVLVGCALVEVEPSQWLLLCSSCLALLLALGKRRTDIVSGLDERHRPVLAGYDRRFLDQALTVVASISLLSYALYCMEATAFVPGREFAGLPFVAFGVLDYLRLAYREHTPLEPVDLVLSSPSLWLCGVGWLFAVSWSLRPLSQG